jgi:regulator of protease activity HflC (stomatin/prohibitin superfamily)
LFNPKSIARFVFVLLITVLPILGVDLLLSVAAALVYRWTDWRTLASSWQFWLAALGGAAPSLLALLAAYILAARFTQHLYGLKNVKEARSFVLHCLFGLFGFPPWLRVNEGKIEADRDHVLMRAGGPGHLVVYNSNMVLLEKAGRFSRIAGTGFCRLEKMEKIYDVVDLRPKRQVCRVEAMSKEGIPITCEADVSYQIDNEGVPPTEEVPFPASEDKVFQAAIATWIREAYRAEESQTMDWSGRVISSETEGTLRTILARYPLDRLIGLASLGSEHSREEIRRELEERLKADVPQLGARLLSVELGDIQVQDEVTQQWIDAWKAEWTRWSTERKALGQAKQAEQIESAKTRAQIMMLAAITEALQPLVERQQEVTSKLVLARLFMVLSRAPSDPLTRINLPKEAVGTLKLLKDLIV